MSVDYLLGDDGDIVIVNGSPQYTSTIEQSSKQQAIISLNTYKGEWDFNTLAGIPWIKNENNNVSVLGKGTKELLDSLVQQDILDRENIVKIIEYNSVLDNSTRVLSLSFIAETNEGSTITINDVLSI